MKYARYRWTKKQEAARDWDKLIPDYRKVDRIKITGLPWWCSG